jgi:hypothetical protein
MAKQDLPNQQPPATEQIFQLCIGYMASISLNVVTKLSIAEQLARSPMDVEDLARVAGVNADALYRVMRALSTVGVFHEVARRRFEQTPLSDLLRADHPQSLRSFVLFFPDPLHFRSYANLMHSVKTGQPTGMPTFGQELFEYYRDHPEESAVFNAAMMNMTATFIPAVLAAYDFSETRVLVDVGGGHGSVVGAILQKYPQMRGILFDVDHVVQGAEPHLRAMGVADRCEIVAGDFFKSVPRGGDTYIMKNIIHDWDDERSLRILKNIGDQLKKNQPRGRVILLEMILTSGNEPQLGKWADIEMLALAGGRERTEDEYRELFAKAGFRLARITPTQSPQSVIEAVPM